MASNLRIGGLASGLDIDQIVKDLMAAARKPVDKLKQDKTLLQWKKDDYRTMNTQLRTLRDEVSKMRLQSTFLSRKVNSSDDAVVTASAANNAAPTTYTIKVTRMAEIAKNQSSGAISADPANKIDPNQSIWSQKDKFATAIGEPTISWIIETVTDDEVTVTTTGKNQKLNHDLLQSTPATIDVKDVNGNIKTYTVVGTNPPANANEVYVNTTTGELVFGEDIQKDSKIIASYSYNTKKFNSSFTIYDETGKAVTKTFTVEAANETLNSLLNRLSSDRSLGIAIFYDTSQDKVSISTTRTGDYNTSGQEIVFGTDGFLKNILKLDEANETGGIDAQLEINGLATTKKSNEFAINGTTFTLKGKLNTEATVSVTHDGDAIFNSIKSFIDKYNEIIAKIDAEVKEERYRDYLPLTEEQKKEMSDDEVKLWEEKARSGMLKGDPILRGVLDKMRYAWSNPVQGLDAKYDQMSEYGLSTGTYLEGGKLYITDEQKLKDAINNNPEEVLKFFTQKSETGNESEKGVAQRLYDAINKAIADITKQAGSELSLSKYDSSILSERIKDIDERIKQKEDRLLQLEDRYWRQFTAMEQAIQRANMQSAWLMQQFSQ